MLRRGKQVGDARSEEAVMGWEINLRTLTGHPNAWSGEEGLVWCPRAMMRAVRPFGPGSKEELRGGTHFAPGAHIFLRRSMGYRDDIPDAKVVGRHRVTHCDARMIIRASWPEGWHTDLVYSLG
jgi:hypothetical protein